MKKIDNLVALDEHSYFLEEPEDIVCVIGIRGEGNKIGRELIIEAQDIFEIVERIIFDPCPASGTMSELEFRARVDRWYREEIKNA